MEKKILQFFFPKLFFSQIKKEKVFFCVKPNHIRLNLYNKQTKPKQTKTIIYNNNNNNNIYNKPKQRLL